MPTNDRIRKITILQLRSEIIQARIINEDTHRAKLPPRRWWANRKQQPQHPVERSGITTLGQCSNVASPTGGQPGGIWRFQKHPAPPGNCSNKPEPRQAFGSDFQGTRGQGEHHHKETIRPIQDVQYPLKQLALTFLKNKGKKKGRMIPGWRDKRDTNSSYRACTFNRS